MPQYSPVKPEVMSPAGFWPQLRAAVEAGADSVYFGLKHFTARAKVGFGVSELPEVMRTLHRRGVKGFVTFNTLIFEHELHEAARAVASIADSGADAVIVQDVGMVPLIRQIAPDLEIHGSTQMSITSAEGVEFAHELGVSRVTLARELSLDDVRRIRSATPVELEIFVHGALCVAYSGQCFSSEAWGGRSANRGQCAQACRLPYELIVDGEVEPTGDARYLLSPEDLYALEHIPEIVRIGISALKIEGRYKDAEYVALTTRAYRKAVDEACAGLPLSVTTREKLALEQVYSRGLGAHFISGTNHQTVVNGRAPRHRGVLIGEVRAVRSGAVTIEPSTANALAPLKAGDGLVFDAAHRRSPEEQEEGGHVYAVTAKGRALELRFGTGDLDFSRISPGDLVWRTHDPETAKAAKPYLEASAPLRRQPVRAAVRAHAGEPLSIRWALVEQPANSVLTSSAEALSKAQNRGVTYESLSEQLGRLGGTAYELAALEADINGDPFVPVSLLNRLRREAVDALAARQGEIPKRVERDPEHVVNAALSPAEGKRPRTGEPQIHLLVRTPEQLEAAIEAEASSITLDYLDLYGLRPSVERVRAAGREVRVASPRVLKQDEEKIIDFLLRLEAPLLVRSAGLLQHLRGREHAALTGDFSLNVANSITGRHFLEIGCARITPTGDLNAAQVADLALQLGAGVVEAVAYQHLPVFHTEHCVFCRFLSNGTSYKDCGRPCEKHVLSVRDVAGRAHPVIADVGCRNTVFGAESQEASLHLQGWLDAGIRHFRLEFAHESGAQVRAVAALFGDALRGRLDGPALRDRLRRIAPQGVTEGSLFVPQDYLTLPVLQ